MTPPLTLCMLGSLACPNTLTPSQHVKWIDSLFTFTACPSAPKDFKVAEVTRHHVHLMWEAPEHDGGSPVTHYQIEKREVSRKTWAKVHLSVYL